MSRTDRSAVTDRTWAGCTNMQLITDKQHVRLPRTDMPILHNKPTLLPKRIRSGWQLAVECLPIRGYHMCRTTQQRTAMSWGTSAHAVVAAGCTSQPISSLSCTQGTLRWASGERYDGEWVEGEEDGLGVFTWRDESTYDGFWQSGKKHGIGVSFMGTFMKCPGS